MSKISTTWKQAGVLPYPITWHASAKYKDIVYLIGGFKAGGADSATVDVWYARLEPNGSVSTWRQATPLPAKRNLASAVVAANDWLYVFGGQDLAGGEVMNTCWAAKIGANGQLGPWRTIDVAFPPRAAFGAVVDGNRIYFIGGVTTGLVFFNEVWVADAVANGDLQNWRQTTGLPVPIGHCQASLVYNGSVYVAGGAVDANAANNRREIISAKIGADGLLGPWSEVARLPLGWQRMAVAQHGSDMLLFGGAGSVAGNLDRSFWVKLNPSGRAGEVVEMGRLPEGRQNMTAVIHNGRVYLIGGSTTVATIWTASI